MKNLYKKVKFDVIYSIGIDCGTAMYLNRHYLRKCSGPFDWITGQGLLYRCQLISNNFNNFFVKSDFKKQKINKNGLYDHNNDSYYNEKTKFYFYHDFKAGEPFNYSYNKFKEKYQRRIARMYNKIRKSSNSLFVYFSQQTITNNQEIINAFNLLKSKFNSNIYLLIIEHRDNLQNTIKSTKIGNIIIINLYTKVYKEELSLNGGYTTLGNEKQINKIFRKIKIKNTLKDKIKILILKTNNTFAKIFKKIINKVLMFN